MEEHVATLNIKNLPDALHRKLRERANLHHRSMTQEVTRILAGALEEAEPLSLLALRGLGKDQWRGVDPTRHVEAERRSWD